MDNKEFDLEAHIKTLKPMICKKCGTVNPMQKMINTANCVLTEGCDGFMKDYVENN